MRIFVVAITSVLAAAVVLASAFVGLNWAPDRPVAELKARWAQAPSVFLDIAGMDVHLRDEGPREDAMPIILLHGTSASLRRCLVLKSRTDRRTATLEAGGASIDRREPGFDGAGTTGIPAVRLRARVVPLGMLGR